MIQLVAAAIGIGLQAYGAYEGARSARKQSEISRAIAADEQKIEAQKRQAMELDARRRSLEVVRNQQRARALALANATNQGAAQGSGLQGGYGQISGDSGTNLLGINQNLMIGRNIFDINEDISKQKMLMAGEQANAAEAQAWSSLGGSLMGASGTMGNLFKGFGNPASTSSSPNYNTYGGQVRWQGQGGIY